ncbi:phage integrase SAM-like domain-containing protein, partial [Mediterraneibacter gnavus]
LMKEYEAYLKSHGVAMNTVSFYNRILRAVYNRAVEKEMTVQRYPFKHVYTGIDKTVKRAVPLKIIKRIKELDLPLKSS